ncbi:MAG: 3-coathanger stack domain-containing protein, partial [Bacteroidota bacterium]
PAVRGIDRLNNVEQVTLDDPTAGNYTLSIKGTSVPVGPQKYYLVYDFIYDEITVTYPLGGEGVVPNTTERIHWDAFGTQGNFLLEYTTDDGANWTTIATVNGIERLYLWTIPSTITGAAKVRVSRGTNSDESDQTFSIIGRPTGIEVAEVCADRIRIIWNNVAGATGYDVFMLGQKTMEVVGSSTQSSYEFTNIDPFEQYWVAVRATGSNGLTGRRSNAISINEQTFSCALPNDLLLSSIITPGSSVNTCFSSAPNVSIKIRNQGQNDVPQFTASYQLNGGNIVTETISTPLASSGETTYTFSAALANYTANTTNNLRTWVTLVDDDFRGNDTLSTAFYVSSGTSTLPSVTNFNDQNNCATSTDCEGTSCSLSLTTNWQNATNGSQDDVDWRVNSGITFSQNTGPTNDFDLGTSNGKYLYLETSGNCNQKVAQLISSCIDLGGTNSPQFYFYYHMYGSAMGELHVDLFDGTTWIDDINVPVVGNQGDDWYPYTVDLSNYKSVPILLRIRGITGNDFTSDIAIDYIGLREQGRPDCARIDFPVDGSEGVDIGFQTVAWRPAFDATGYRLKIGTTSGGDDVLATTDVGNVLAYDLATILSENTTYYISVTPYNSMGDALNCVPSTFKTGTAPTAPYCEDVEEHTVNFSRVNQKGWQSFTQNTYRWLPDSGGTPSSGTGPTSASSGTNYFYTEASGASTGDTILLYAPTIDISQLSSPILTFDYHMYGGAMGTLRVDAFDGSQWQNNIWSISGQQQSSGNEAWRTASITLPTFSNKNTIRLRFFARRGNSYTSDIAIDDICVVESPPPPCVALQTPSSGENLVSTTVTLSWAGQASADGYFLKIGTMPDGDDFLSMTDIGATTSYQPATPFDYLTTYYVTLLGYNGQGIASNCAASYFKTIYDSGIRECGTVKAENYCYGNSSEAQFPYTSGDPTLPLKIDFLAGKLEVPFDSIKVYDGVNTAANLLYGGNNNGDLTGLTLTTTGSDLLVVVKADESVSCASQSTCCNVPLQWEVGRIEAGGAGLSSDCECDPSNPNHQHLVLDGSREGNPQIVSRVYHANVTIESKGHVLSADTVHFKAGSVIDLNPGFDAQMGSIFEAEMAACDNSNSFRVDVLPVAVSLEKPASTSPIIKVYPNPFQATLNIALHLNLPTKVNLNVYDQLGKQVAVITPSTNLDSGVHTFLFSGDDLLGGIYFLTLDAPSGRIVKKIIKM